AVLFGINLYATSRVATDLPLAWTVLPARVAGVVLVTIPLVLIRSLPLVRPAVGVVVFVGLAEVLGTATYAFGSRDSAAIAAVLASQFAAIAALAASFLFWERTNRVQIAGVVTIAVGVATLALLQALCPARRSVVCPARVDALVDPPERIVEIDERLEMLL